MHTAIGVVLDYFISTETHRMRTQIPLVALDILKWQELAEAVGYVEPCFMKDDRQYEYSDVDYLAEAMCVSIPTSLKSAKWKYSENISLMLMWKNFAIDTVKRNYGRSSGCIAIGYPTISDHIFEDYDACRILVNDVELYDRLVPTTLDDVPRRWNTMYRPRYKIPMLHRACSLGEWKLARYILKKFPDTNVDETVWDIETCRYYSTPIMYTTTNYKMFKILMDRGANLDVKLYPYINWLGNITVREWAVKEGWIL